MSGSQAPPLVRETGNTVEQMYDDAQRAMELARNGRHADGPAPWQPRAQRGAASSQTPGLSQEAYGSSSLNSPSDPDMCCPTPGYCHTGPAGLSQYNSPGLQPSRPRQPLVPLQQQQQHHYEQQQHQQHYSPVPSHLQFVPATQQPQQQIQFSPEYPWIACCGSNQSKGRRSTWRCSLKGSKRAKGQLLHLSLLLGV